jgi:hypothetical protein
VGSIWLNGRTAGYPSVYDVLRNAGCQVATYSGWETRSRSSGGFNGYWGVICHHTASQTTPANDLNYMVSASDGPVSNGLLDRTGLFTIIGAGATNHAGKGGGQGSSGGGTPWVTSRGTIPMDSANSYVFGIEAANNGVGEPWPKAQTDAYVKMCQALCQAYGFVVASDIRSHNEWTPPRKIDPRGPSPWQPANANSPWDMNGFRNTVGQLPAPIPPSPEDDDMPKPYLVQVVPDGTVYICSGDYVTYRWITDGDSLARIQADMKAKGYDATLHAIQPAQLADQGILVGPAVGGTGVSRE